MANTTKKNLIEKISTRTGLSQIDTKIVVDCFFDVLGDSLRNGKNIELRGFGRFKLKEKLPRVARNPQNNKPIKVAGGVKMVFEPSKDLKARVNGA